MNILDYIQDERRGRKAHQLERESMSDPFLSDAIDGYDRVNDNPVYYLKILQKQVTKRSRDRSYHIRLWSVAACVLGIICISVIFFLYDPNRWEEAFYVENQVEEPPVAGDTIISEEKEEDVIVDNTNKQKKEDTNTRAIRKEEITYFSKAEKMQNDFWNESESATNESATLTNAEIQDVFSERGQGEIMGKKEKKEESIIQTPKPVIGESAYNEYLKKNRNLPKGDACESRHGKVILLFQVNEKGRPIKITVLRSLCQSADNEAIRLLQNGPSWTPGENNVRLEVPF